MMKSSKRCQCPVLVQVFLVSVGVSAIAVALLAQAGVSQAGMNTRYGVSITLEAARRVATSAMEEARKNNWEASVAVVDASANLIYFEKGNDSQSGSGELAISKARSAVIYKRPTENFQGEVAAGTKGVGLLRLQGAVILDGGIPLILSHTIIGGIGVSGTSQHDGTCAQAGADVLKQ